MDRTDFRKRMEKVDPLNKANPFAKLRLSKLSQSIDPPPPPHLPQPPPAAAKLAFNTSPLLRIVATGHIASPEKHVTIHPDRALNEENSRFPPHTHALACSGSVVRVSGIWAWFGRWNKKTHEQKWQEGENQYPDVRCDLFDVVDCYTSTSNILPIWVPAFNLLFSHFRISVYFSRVLPDSPGPPLPGWAGRGPASASPPTTGAWASRPSPPPPQPETLPAGWTAPAKTKKQTKTTQSQLRSREGLGNRK